MAPAETLDMTNVLKLLDDAKAIAEQLDGQKVNLDNLNNKDIMRTKADLNRQTLYAAHLADCARLGLMNEYHRFKGEQPPAIIA